MGGGDEIVIFLSSYSTYSSFCRSSVFSTLPSILGHDDTHFESPYVVILDHSTVVTNSIFVSQHVRSDAVPAGPCLWGSVVGYLSSSFAKVFSHSVGVHDEKSDVL